ncbi:hypothetical protein DFH09DRAFT_1372178 [Mycena vulgaris]|nr:hypothetical protein DFH09DRAFT_1372178 [Mycena vulgaris]
MHSLQTLLSASHLYAVIYKKAYEILDELGDDVQDADTRWPLFYRATVLQAMAAISFYATGFPPTPQCNISPTSIPRTLLRKRNDDHTVKYFLLDVDQVVFLGQSVSAPKAEQSPNKIASGTPARLKFTGFLGGQGTDMKSGEPPSKMRKTADNRAAEEAADKGEVSLLQLSPSCGCFSSPNQHHTYDMRHQRRVCPCSSFQPLASAACARDRPVDAIAGWMVGYCQQLPFQTPGHPIPPLDDVAKHCESDLVPRLRPEI